MSKFERDDWSISYDEAIKSLEGRNAWFQANMQYFEAGRVVEVNVVPQLKTFKPIACIGFLWRPIGWEKIPFSEQKPGRDLLQPEDFDRIRERLELFFEAMGLKMKILSLQAIADPALQRNGGWICPSEGWDISITGREDMIYREEGRDLPGGWGMFEDAHHLDFESDWETPSGKAPLTDSDKSRIKSRSIRYARLEGRRGVVTFRDLSRLNKGIDPGYAEALREAARKALAEKHPSLLSKIKVWIRSLRK